MLLQEISIRKVAMKKHQVVRVELAQMLLYWKCPNCNKANEDFFKRNAGFVEELQCECGTVLKRQGEVQWIVTDLAP
jgi:hypothetical protein